MNRVVFILTLVSVIVFAIIVCNAESTSVFSQYEQLIDEHEEHHLMYSEDLVEAEALLRSILAEGPDPGTQGEACLHLGRVLYADGRDAEAVDMFLEAYASGNPYVAAQALYEIDILKANHWLYGFPLEDEIRAGIFSVDASQENAYLLTAACLPEGKFDAMDREQRELVRTYCDSMLNLPCMVYADPEAACGQYTKAGASLFAPCLWGEVYLEALTEASAYMEKIEAPTCYLDDIYAQIGFWYLGAGKTSEADIWFEKSDSLEEDAFSEAERNADPAALFMETLPAGLIFDEPTDYGDDTELVSSNTMAEESRSILWVMEKWKAEYDAEWGDIYPEELYSRVIKCLNTGTTEITEYEIPINWIPLASAGIADKLYFAAEEMTDSGKSFDIIEWSPQKSMTVCEKIVIHNTERPISFTDSGLLISDEEKSYWIIKDGIRRKYAFSENIYDSHPSQITQSSILVNVGLLTSVYDDQKDKDKIILIEHMPDELEIRETINEDTQYSFSDFSDFPGIQTNLGSNYLLFWRSLSVEHIQTVTLYVYPYEYPYFDGEQEAKAFPLHSVIQLQKLDRNASSSSAYMTSTMSTIELVDLYPSDTGMLVIGDMLYVICSDYSPSLFTPYVEDELLFYGRTVLMSISLETGEQRVLYETGYEKPNYDLLWRYIAACYGTVREDGSFAHTCPSELEEEVYRSLHEIPTYQNRDGIVEYFPDNFCIMTY